MTRQRSRSSSTSRGSCKRFKVFEFTKEDERVEKASEKFLGKFGNPRKNNSSPIDKYKFLQFFTGRSMTKRKLIYNEPINVDAEVAHGTKTPEKESSDKLLDFDASAIGHPFTYSVSDSMGMLQGDEVLKEGTSGLDTCVLSSSSNYENEQIGMISDDDDDRIEMSSSSTSTSPLVEYEVSSEEQVSEYGSGGHEIDSVNRKVLVFPDFVQHGNMYCMESQLTFSSSCIKVEGSTVNGTRGTFSYEWAIGDIINIESEWNGKVETAIVSLLLKSKDSKGAENANETSGIELLKFAVFDPFWSEGQEAIKSLDVRYKDLLNITLDADRENEENTFLGQILRPRLYDFAESFEDIIYPKGDPDAVSISKRDIERLQPDTFINDTIIDFYIKYLKNKIQSSEQHRFHFFNSFFFRKLADLDKGPSSACEGREAFQRVQKWTRKVNLFEKDYIFVPVNYSFHWSLIVICYPGEVAYFKDDEVEKLPKVPCILHMDSIKGSHRDLKRLVQSYLCEEWKERHSNREAFDNVPSKFLHLRFIPLELPQQENFFDCGLFLLHYVELFLEEAPANFNPFKIKKFSNFLSRNWFPPAEASLKRVYIQKLIYGILEEHYQKVSSADCTVKCPSSQVPDKNEQETGVEFLKEICRSEKACYGYSSISDAGKGTEILLSAASPQKVVRSFGNSEFTCRELFEPGISAGSFSNGNYQRIAALHWRGIVSPIEEVEESGEKVSNSPLDVEDCQQVTELATHFTAPAYSSKTFRQLETSWNQQFSMHLEECDEGDLDSRTSMNESQNSFEVFPDEGQIEFAGSNQLEKTCGPESPSITSEELADCVVEDSQETNGMHDGKESNDFSSFHGNLLTLSHQEENLTESINLKENDGDPVSEIEGQQAAKRPISSRG